MLYLRQHYHFGPGRIADYLKRFHQRSLAVSSVHRILVRHGLNRLPASQKHRPLFGNPTAQRRRLIIRGQVGRLPDPRDQGWPEDQAALQKPEGRHSPVSTVAREVARLRVEFVMFDGEVGRYSRLPT